MQEFSSKKTKNFNDRLSNLPEPLQVHILSFLDTKQAIQTCLLSKQWVNLWTLLSDFDFGTSENLRSFEAIFKKLLSSRKEDSVKINSLGFGRKPMPSGKYYFERVLDFVVSHGVQSLVFTLRNTPREQQYYRTAMTRLCSFDFLKSLKLEYATLDNLLSLKQLVTLHLQNVAFNFTSEDFSGCPNLESLTLKSCFTFGIVPVSLVIDAPRLSSLMISDCHCFGKFVLFTPRLTFFGYDGLDPVFVETGDIPALIHTIDIDILSFPCDDNAPNLKLINMLKSFPAAKVVRLSSRILESLSMCHDILEEEPLPFCNLKVLKVSHNTDVMTYLLGKSPNATILVE